MIVTLFAHLFSVIIDLLSLQKAERESPGDSSRG
jgi:hypothetical protein